MKPSRKYHRKSVTKTPPSAGSKIRSNQGSTGKIRVRIDSIQSDHELFLQAYEKPTQIYRFLRTRNMISPVFLHRNLSFMQKSRLSRNEEGSNRIKQDRTGLIKNKREEFKIDSWAKSLMKDKRDERNRQDQTYKTIEKCDKFANLTLLGYYDQKIEKTLDKVILELVLVKRPMDFPLSPCLQIPIGVTEIHANPSEDYPPSKASALSIPTESFNIENDYRIKNCSLIVRVYHKSLSNGCTQRSSKNNQRKSDQGGHFENNSQDLIEKSQNDDEKENQDPVPASKRRKLNQHSDFSKAKSFISELQIHNNQSQFVLTEGEYELILEEIKTDEGEIMEQNLNDSTKSENNPDLAEYQDFNAFSNLPTLKFQLKMDSEPTAELVKRPRPIVSRDSCHAPLQNGRRSSLDTQGDLLKGFDTKTFRRLHHFFYSH